MTPRLPDGRTPVLLSAHADGLINQAAADLLGYLDREPWLTDVSRIAQQVLRTRRIRRYRAIIRAADRDELQAGLQALVDGEEHPLVARSAEGSAPRMAFVFPGQGNQWPGMGTDPYRHLPVYRAEADKCDAEFVAAGEPSPLRYLTAATDVDTFSQREIQGAQFTHAVALARVWRSCGIVPDLTLGHSLGEVAAAYIAETITAAAAVAVVCARAGVVDDLPGRYGMAVLGVTPDAARELIAATPGWLELSVVNSSSSVVVSGDRDAVAAIVGSVTARGEFGSEIAVTFPGHTSALEALRDELHSRLPQSEFTDTPVQFIGSATGAVVPPGTDFTDYWYRNLRNTVRFDHAVTAATQCSARAFVELSAHPSLLFAMSDVLEDSPELPQGPAVLVGSGHRDEPLIDQLSTNIAAAAIADPGYRWADLLGSAGEPLWDFPNAPMREVHLWAAPEPLSPVESLSVTAAEWREHSLPSAPPSSSQRTVGVLPLGEDDTLAQRLSAAVDRHPGVVSAPTGQADLLVVIAPGLEQADVVPAAAELADLIGTGLLGYVDSIGPHCRDVWLVTVGGEQVHPDEPVALPGPAALGALHRSIGFEHPDQAFHHVDLPSPKLTDEMAGIVIDALLTGAGETALRDGGDRAVRYRRSLGADPPPAPAWQLESGLLDDVVITGGSGTIGLHYAHYLAEHGARRIVLLSRRGVDPAVVADLTQRYDVEVVSPPCDITDRAAVAAAAAEFGGDGATLLIHAAGTATFGTREHLSGAALADMSAAKLAGLAHLRDVWPLRPDARILLCSSVIGVWGGKGVAGYAAANRMLDVMATELRANGQHCFSVRWGLWQGSDIVDAAEIARVERSGLRPMPPVPAVEASLCDYPDDPLVLSGDPDRLQKFFGSQEFADDDAVDVVDSDRVPSGAAGVGTAAAVRAELASALSITDAAGIDLDASLFDLGVDSLLALDLRKRIKRATGRTVPLARLLSGITASDLIAGLEISEETKRPEKVEFSRD